MKIYKTAEANFHSEYEIINLFDGFNRFYKKCNGKFTINLQSEYSLDQLLSSSDIKILTVKRLSDNAIFEVGEKIKIDDDVITEITEFKIDDNDGSINVYTEYENVFDIIYINKNPILLITEDGVDIYENDVVFIVSKEYTPVYDFVCKSNNINILERDSLKFSNREYAEEYLVLNKPVQLSIKDIENMIETIKFNSFDQRIDFINKLKCFVRSKTIIYSS